MGVPISSLPAASALTGAEQYPIVQNGTTKRTTLNASGVVYDPAGTGAVTTTVQETLRRTVSVFDFMTAAQISDVKAGTALIDVTTPLQNAIASGAKVIYWPAGKYKITGTLDGARVGEWIGAGPCDSSYSEPSASEGTILRCVGANGGNAFVIAPRAMSGFHIDGVDKTGVGIDFGREYYFAAFGNFKRITIRRFDTAMRMFNLFNCYWESIVIEGNVRGVKAMPLNDPAYNGGDNGYFTTLTWKDFYIRNNDVYGVDAYTPKGGKDWTWENCILEANGTVGGTFQSSLANMSVAIRGGYWEAAPTVPGLKISSCTLSIDVGVFNGSGGLNCSSAANKVSFVGVSFSDPTDAVINYQFTKFYLENCDFQTNVRDNAADVEIFNTYFASDSSTIRKNSSTLSIGTTANGTPSVIRHAIAYKKTISGTVPAGGRLEVVDRQYSFGVWNNAYGSTVAQATLECYDAGRYDLIPYVIYGDSVNNFSVELYNRSASAATITNAELTIMFTRVDAQAI